MKKLLRITTSYESLDSLLKGQLNFLSQYYEVVGVASGKEELKKIAERENVRTVHIPMQREIRLMSDLKSIFLMLFLILKEKPYIVHTNTPKASLLSMLVAQICRVPYRIYTVTGLRYETAEGVFKKILIMMERITCMCATHVIPEGEGVKMTLLRDKITKKPLHKILNGNINGVDTVSFNKTSDVIQQTHAMIKKDCFTFVFVGRLVRDKGMIEIAVAFDRLYHKFPNIRLILVGPFEDKLDPLPVKTMRLLENNPAIELKGTQEDVRPFLAVSDALVFPSYREGFPNVVLEAGAMGLPCIVTDINGCNEIIIDGINGIIIPPKDEEALYIAMRSFIENPDKVKKLADHARELIISRYEQKMVWQAILEKYRKIESGTF